MHRLISSFRSDPLKQVQKKTTQARADVQKAEAVVTKLDELLERLRNLQNINSDDLAVPISEKKKRMALKEIKSDREEAQRIQIELQKVQDINLPDSTKFDDPRSSDLANVALDASVQAVELTSKTEELTIFEQKLDQKQPRRFTKRAEQALNTLDARSQLDSNNMTTLTLITLGQGKAKVKQHATNILNRKFNLDSNQDPAIARNILKALNNPEYGLDTPQGKLLLNMLGKTENKTLITELLSQVGQEFANDENKKERVQLELAAPYLGKKSPLPRAGSVLTDLVGRYQRHAKSAPQIAKRYSKHLPKHFNRQLFTDWAQRGLDSDYKALLDEINRFSTSGKKGQALERLESAVATAYVKKHGLPSDNLGELFQVLDT